MQNISANNLAVNHSKPQGYYKLKASFGITHSLFIH